MALIGKIRRNSWLLVVMLALGLGGFIVMDMTSAGGGRGTNQFTVGEVNGETIDWQEMQRAERILYANAQNNDVYSQRNFLWNYFVEETLVEQEAEKNGISVGEEEMEELTFGTNLSPVVSRNFTDPNTNQLNRENLNAFKQAYDAGTLAPEYQEFWNFQEQEVRKDRLQTKLVKMVEKGIYTPTWMAERFQVESSGKTSFQYVKIPFDQIDESAVEVTEDDYRAYYARNKVKFERDEETRDAEFVVFEVLPTAGDSVQLLETMEELVEDFRTTDDDSLFVENNFGTIDITYFKKEQLSPIIADTVFEMPLGAVYGPYIEGGAYKAVKVLDKMTIPDSVESRHILLRVENQEDILPAQRKADSLKTLIESGVATFDTLAKQFSEDPGSAILGGDLGYSGVGRMVKPFNDMIFYQADVGEVNLVYTQFGIHLVEVTDKKYINDAEGLQVAYIQEAIIPSEETQDLMYDDVLEFVGNHRTLEVLRSTAESDPDIEIEEAKALKINDYVFGTLGSGNTSREIIRWMFDEDTDEADVAPEVYIYEDPVNYFNAKYVVAGLSKVIPAGVPDLDDVREEFAETVRNQKKGEAIAAQITSTDLIAIADQYETTIDSVEQANASTTFMRGIGNEPKVLANAMALDVNAVSQPIIGESGVFVIRVYDKSEPTPPENLASVRQQAAFQLKNAARFELMEALKNSARIDDNRYTYY